MGKFIAAMDNSGGSAGGVLDTYQQAWTEENKMELIHEFRLRMINASGFNSDNIFGCILYKDSVERGIVPGLNELGIKSILKVDSGVHFDGTLKQFPVKQMCHFANQHGCWGTKMRSIVQDEVMLDTIVKQQFAIAKTIYDEGLMPIVEPEVPIDHPNKYILELKLKESIEKHLTEYQGECILKLTLPSKAGLYDDLQDRVYWVVALSGGYTLNRCVNELTNNNMGASFSRALSEGLVHSMSYDEFNTHLNRNIEMIASVN